MAVILYFSTPTCNPCRAFFPVVQEVCSANQLHLQRVDASQDVNAAQQYGVTSVPTIVVVNNGNELFRHTGTMSKSQLANILTQFK
jgi:thioredoxin 1